MGFNSGFKGLIKTKFQLSHTKKKNGQIFYFISNWFLPRPCYDPLVDFKTLVSSLSGGDIGIRVLSRAVKGHG